MIQHRTHTAALFEYALSFWTLRWTRLSESSRLRGNDDASSRTATSSSRSFFFLRRHRTGSSGSHVSACVASFKSILGVSWSEYFGRVDSGAETARNHGAESSDAGCQDFHTGLRERRRFFLDTLASGESGSSNWKRRRPTSPPPAPGPGFESTVVPLGRGSQLTLFLNPNFFSMKTLLPQIGRVPAVLLVAWRASGVPYRRDACARPAGIDAPNSGARLHDRDARCSLRKNVLGVLPFASDRHARGSGHGELALGRLRRAALQQLRFSRREQLEETLFFEKAARCCCFD